MQLTAFEIAFEDSLSAGVIFVSHLLAQAELILEWRCIDGTDKCLTEMQFVDAEVDLKQLVHQVQHAPPLGVFF